MSNKKPWSQRKAKAFVSEACNLIKTLNLFKSRWADYANSREKPSGAIEAKLSETEMELNKCLDDFLE